MVHAPEKREIVIPPPSGFKLAGWRILSPTESPPNPLPIRLKMAGGFFCAQDHPQRAQAVAGSMD